MSDVDNCLGLQAGINKCDTHTKLVKNYGQ